MENAHIILLSGEAGIGKSRLAVAVQEIIRDEPHFRISYFCSPHHQDSALHPIITQLQRAAGFQQADLDETKWAKLEVLLRTTAPLQMDVALLGNLLSLPSEVVLTTPPTTEATDN